MLILGIESASMTAGAALVRDGRVVAEYSLDNKKTHSQTLLPMIDEILRRADVEKKQIDLIAVSAGPGSYTGLRIGSATAKGIGLALNRPLVSVSTLEALAQAACFPDGMVCPIMDARRGQVYTALYRMTLNRPEVIKEPCCVDAADWFKELENMGKPILFNGDAVDLYSDQLLSLGHLVAPAHLARPRAATVALIGQWMAEAGQTQAAEEHVPEYLKKSQAERNREAAEASREGSGT